MVMNGQYIEKFEGYLHTNSFSNAYMFIFDFIFTLSIIYNFSKKANRLSNEKNDTDKRS